MIIRIIVLILGTFIGKNKKCLKPHKLYKKKLIYQICKNPRYINFLKYFFISNDKDLIKINPKRIKKNF